MIASLRLAISLATCVATKLRDKLQHKLHGVTAPLHMSRACHRKMSPDAYKRPILLLITE